MFETKDYRVELIYVEDLGECRRVIFHGNYDKPWFAGVDIARCIGYEFPRNFISKFIKKIEPGHVKHLFPLETIKSMKVPKEFKPKVSIYKSTIVDAYVLNLILLNTAKTNFYRNMMADIANKFKTNPSLYSVDYIL